MKLRCLQCSGDVKLIFNYEVICSGRMNFSRTGMICDVPVRSRTFRQGQAAAYLCYRCGWSCKSSCPSTLRPSVCIISEHTSPQLIAVLNYDGEIVLDHIPIKNNEARVQHLGEHCSSSSVDVTSLTRRQLWKERFKAAAAVHNGSHESKDLADRTEGLMDVIEKSLWF